MLVSQLYFLLPFLERKLHLIVQILKSFHYFQLKSSLSKLINKFEFILLLLIQRYKLFPSTENLKNKFIVFMSYQNFNILFENEIFSPFSEIMHLNLILYCLHLDSGILSLQCPLIPLSKSLLQRSLPYNIIPLLSEIPHAFLTINRKF